MSVQFHHFLEKFPEVELPVTLSDDTHLDFSKENLPLPPQMIEEHITRYEATEPDEFTEYIACFSIIPTEKDFKIVVYWKAGLLNYDYVLATYDKKGKMLDKKAIAGTKVIGEDIKRSIAIIKEDLTIQVVEGIEEKGKIFDPEATKTRRYEVLSSGMIEQDY
jgi:hypothetical protein